METNQAVKENTENPGKTETGSSENEGFDFTEIRNRAIVELKKWQSLLISILTKPSSTTAALPTKGDWTIPIIYSATSGVLMGVFTAAGLFQISLGAGLVALISGILTGSIGVFVGGAILNVILTVVAKDPGFYRTIYLTSILSIFTALGTLASLFIPFVGSLTSLGYLYVLYFYCQSCAGFTKKQAQIFVGILVALAILPFLGAFGLMTIFSRY